MRKTLRWLLPAGAAVAVLAGLLLAGLGRWAASEDFRDRAARQASAALGVPVQLGRIELDLWPRPGVVLHAVQLGTKPALTLQQVEARPGLASLLTGRPQLDALVVREAVLPQQGLLALLAQVQKADTTRPARAPEAAASAAPVAAPGLPRQVVLDRVTWIDADGRRLTVQADVAFDGSLLPQSARAEVVDGRFAGARLRLQRQADAWQLLAEIGGGTVSGPLRLDPRPDGGSRFSGELVIDKVQVAALTAPARPLTGRLEARTSLLAEFRDPAELAKVLRTQSRFTVRQAVVQGIDLAKAVGTLGASRGGQTALDTLSGQVSSTGAVVQLSNLDARSGLLAATGEVRLAADRSLDGRIQASLAGAVGVPLRVGGTVDAPTVTPTGVALPGGKAAGDLGSRIGQGLRGLFGK